ncbi:hypothetical protein LTR16_003328, partial [Cryomyces antarcticus]
MPHLFKLTDAIDLTKEEDKDMADQESYAKGEFPQKDDGLMVQKQDLAYERGQVWDGCLWSKQRRTLVEAIGWALSQSGPMTISGLKEVIGQQVDFRGKRRIRVGEELKRATHFVCEQLMKEPLLAPRQHVPSYWKWSI